MTSDDNIELLRKMKEEASQGGGPERIARQRAKGKKTARERVVELLDADTFVEMDMFVTHLCTDFGMEEKKILGDGVVTGYGKIEGRDDYIFS
jgi:propionyl-CoA carboxylase beta chain